MLIHALRSQLRASCVVSAVAKCQLAIGSRAPHHSGGSACIEHGCLANAQARTETQVSSVSATIVTLHFTASEPQIHIDRDSERDGKRRALQPSLGTERGFQSVNLLII